MKPPPTEKEKKIFPSAIFSPFHPKKKSPPSVLYKAVGGGGGKFVRKEKEKEKNIEGGDL